MLIKKIFLSLSSLEKIIVIGAVILAAVSGSIKLALYIEANSELQSGHGGTLREGLVGQPVFINPVMPGTTADLEISKLVYASLADMAETINHSVDGKTWNVRLLQDIFWHDGTPLTSDDVIFTLQTILNKDSHSPLFNLFQGVEATRISQLEVEFKLTLPYALFGEESLTRFSVIPKHIFGGLPVQNFGLSVYGLKPIGSGPYKVDSYDKDNRGVINAFYLSANPQYFNGEPYISRVVLNFYRTTDELIRAYNTGRIDSFGLANAYALLKDGIKIRHRANEIKSSGYYAAFINQATDNKHLKDLKVREALSKSLDLPGITQKVFNGYATPFYGPTNFTGLGETPVNTEVLKGVSFTMTVPEEGFLAETAEEMKKTWESFGANITIVPVPLDKIEDVLKRTDYDVILFGNIVGPSGDLFSFWHSSQRFYPGQNLSLYQSKKIDNLIESFGKDFDPESREETLRKISDGIAADYPAIFLYSPRYIYVTIPGLQGFKDSGVLNLAPDRFNNIEEWYVKTKRVFKAVND